MSRSEHRWRELSSQGPSLLPPPRPWTRAFSPVDPADAGPPSRTLGSAKTGSLCNVRPGVLGGIPPQTFGSLWDPPARAHLPTARLYLTLRDPMDFSLPDFSSHSTGENTAVGSRSLFQEIFSTQGLNLGLLHCRQVLYHLNCQGSLQFLTDDPTSLNPLSKCAFMSLISPQILFCFYINKNFHTQFIQRLTEIHSRASKKVTSEFNISVLSVTWHFSP